MTPFKSLSAAAVLLAAAVAVGGCGSSSSSGHDVAGMGARSTVTVTAPATSPSSGASGTGTPAAGPHNDADVMFATGMIPHHQQAIEMSDILLTKAGIAGPVQDLATKIKAAQAPEITLMNGWLTGWGATPSETGMGGLGGMGGMDGMGGMGSGDGIMSQADMDAFKNADGPPAQKMFLTGMIAHHQGAVVMAQRELSQGQNADAKTLAQAIIDAQNAEITQMQRLLGS